jgi:hypothetical protein
VAEVGIGAHRDGGYQIALFVVGLRFTRVRLVLQGRHLIAMADLMDLALEPVEVAVGLRRSSLGNQCREGTA